MDHHAYLPQNGTTPHSLNMSLSLLLACIEPLRSVLDFGLVAIVKWPGESELEAWKAPTYTVEGRCDRNKHASLVV